MLYLAGATDRLGKTAEGNTVCDFDPEEIKRKVSVSSAVAPLEWKGSKINLLDTPGLFDFAAGMYEGARAADCMMIAVSAKSGVSVGTEKAYKLAGTLGKGRMFFITKLDTEHANYDKTLESMRSAFGTSVCPLVLPVAEGGKYTYVNLLDGKAYQYAGGKAKEVPAPSDERIEELQLSLSEAVAETDEDLMEKFFGGESFTAEELHKGVRAGIKDGSLAPVFCGSCATTEGVDLMMDLLVK